MTIRLTLKCTQGCRHCLINALPNSGSMSYDTLDNVLQLLKHIDIPILNISGGEVTEMEDWYNMINYIIDFIKSNNLKTKLSILSNGTFLFDEYKVKQMKELLNKKEVYQLYLSTNPTFYKSYEDVKSKVSKINLSKLKLNLDDRTSTLKNLGRANNLDVNLNTPASCSLSYKIVKNLSNDNIKSLFNRFPTMYCSPMINIDGEIYLGWSNECKSVGNINTDSYDTIYHNIMRFIPCGKCKQLI